MARERFQEPEIKVVREEKKEEQRASRAFVAPPTFVQPFDSWWMQAMSKFKLKADLKEPVRKHFESRGFMASGKYEDGLKDFGFKLP